MRDYYNRPYIGDAERRLASAQRNLDSVRATGFRIERLDDHGKVWESAHRNHMLWEAEKYAKVSPRLVWVFCGQLSMSVEERGGNGWSHLRSHATQTGERSKWKDPAANL